MTKTNKKIYIFYELHLLNLPLAFLLRFFGQVYIFRFRGYCRRFVGSPSFESIPDFVSVDQWVEVKERAWRVFSKYYRARKNANKPDGKKARAADSRDLLQYFITEYERYFLFHTLVENIQGSRRVFSTHFERTMKFEFPELLLPWRGSVKSVGQGLDLLSEILVVLSSWLKLFIRMAIQREAPYIHREYPLACIGTSSVEYPIEQGGLDFSWLVENRILESRDIIYILDSQPNDSSKKLLAQKNIQWVVKDSLFYALPKKVKQDFILSVLRQSARVARSLLRGHCWFELSAAKVHTEQEIWAGVFEMLKVQTVFASFSCGWPESVAISAARNSNRKSIIWFYSAGEFRYSQTYKEFQDLSLRYSLILADEIWVWNAWVKKLFDRRQLDANDAKKIKVIGPLVNASWENDPNLMQWRRQFRFVVGVFDLPSMTTEHRLSHGEGPFCNARLQNEFVGGILRILRDFPDVGVLFKSKREFRDLAYDLVPNLEQVLNLENPRLKILGQRDNPVSAVAACDFVIAVPFTSPVMLALSMGKSAAYYDPTRLCNFSFDQTFDPFMIKNEEDLVSKIKSLMNLQPPIEFDCDYFDSLRERVRREFGKSNPSQKINLENSLIPG